MRPTRPFAALVLASTVCLCAVPAARAEEESPSAIELLRRGNAAETVDRDLEKAIGLYRRVVEMSAQDPVMRQRGLVRLADLLDASGQTELAINAYRDLDGVLDEVDADATLRIRTLLRFAANLEKAGRDDEALATYERLRREFAGKMDEAALQSLEEAAIRHRVKGALAKGEAWLGTKRAEAPIDQKVLSLLQKYEDAPKNEKGISRQEIVAILKPVGAGALPALERQIRTAGPTTAAFAAEIANYVGGTAGIDLLERVATEGDGFAQGAALSGLLSVRASPDRSPRVLAAADRLLAVPSLADRRASLVQLATTHVGSGEEALRRHRLGGPDAMVWLQTALALRAPGAVDRAAEIARATGPEATEARAALVQVGTQDVRDSSMKGTQLAPQDLDAIVDTMLADVGRLETNELSVLGALLRMRFLATPPAESDRVALDLWRRALGIEREDQRRLVLESMTREPRPPFTNALWEDPTVADALVRSWVAGHGSGVNNFVSAAVVGDGPFWDALVRVLPGLPADQASTLLTWTTNRRQRVGQHDLPPARLDAAWIGVLEASPVAAVLQSDELVRAAARSGDPRYLDLVRRNVQPYPTRLGERALKTLKEYRGPGLVEFALELLRAPSDLPFAAALEILAKEADPRAREALAAVASGRTDRGAEAVKALAGAGHTAPVVALMQRETLPQETAASDEYVLALVYAAQNLRSQQAVPFLLLQFRQGNSFVSGHAGQALEAIRRYREQLEAFERWDAARQDDLDVLLKDPDPEIRRAAVLAIAASGGRDVLPRLVRIAKDEKEPRVRAAALQAVERIAAREEQAASPAPAAPAPKPAEGK